MLWKATAIEDEQVETLFELEQRLLQGLAAESAPAHLSRYYILLCEVRERLRELSLSAAR